MATKIERGRPTIMEPIHRYFRLLLSSNLEADGTRASYLELHPRRLHLESVFERRRCHNSAICERSAFTTRKRLVVSMPVILEPQGAFMIVLAGLREGELKPLQISVRLVS
jgi:hypothetical protein